MQDAIATAVLSELAAELSNEELGAAIRIVSRIYESKRPVVLRTLHISAGMDKKAWDQVKESIMPFFTVQDDQVSFGNTAPSDERLVSDVEEEPIVRTLRSRQTEMNLTVRPARRPTVPQYITDSRPPAVSIRKIIFDQALQLFRDAGMSEQRGRSILSLMLKNYSEGDVAMAVSDASKMDVLAEPHTWIMGRLKAMSRKASSNYGTAAPQAKPARKERLVTPERTGISNKKADAIRKQNERLKLNLDDL